MEIETITGGNNTTEEVPEIRCAECQLMPTILSLEMFIWTVETVAHMKSSGVAAIMKNVAAMNVVLVNMVMEEVVDMVVATSILGPASE